jgi:hypothetical protein
LDIAQPSSHIDSVSNCCFLTARSLGKYILPAMILLGVHFH